MTYALASGSPIGVAGLEKTVVTAARRKKGRWVNVQVNLRMPSGEGGMKGLPSRVPQLSFDAAYPHMGILRAVSGCRRAFNRKLAGGVARLMQKVAAVRTDRTQHVLCANALKGAYAGYYVATVGISSSGADRLECGERCSTESSTGSGMLRVLGCMVELRDVAAMRCAVGMC